MIDNHLGYREVIESQEIDDEVVFKIKIKDIRKGELFKKKVDSKTIYERLDYDRHERKYETAHVSGNNFYYLKGAVEVWVGFSY
tara:strand:+ start:177 stop:428 length:252 start_codon:yes stop_codon:yes gene_type:complete